MVSILIPSLCNTCNCGFDINNREKDFIHNKERDFTLRESRLEGLLFRGMYEIQIVFLIKLLNFIIIVRVIVSKYIVGGHKIFWMYIDSWLNLCIAFHKVITLPTIAKAMVTLKTLFKIKSALKARKGINYCYRDSWKT